MTEDARDPFDISHPTETPALTLAEERILRDTIDDPMVFDVPKRTVKRLLVLVDQLRSRHAELARIQGAIDRIKAPDPIHHHSERPR